MRSLLIVSALTLVIGISNAYGENASNPLAAVSNTDIRYQFFDLDGSDRNDYWMDAAYMVIPTLKLKYAVHYWDTDVTGTGESDWESFNIKPIYFPKSWVGDLGAWKYKWSVGGEWIVSAGNEDKGIGSGSDQIAPLIGIALSRGNTVLVPIVQHFVAYNGPDVNITSLRLIAIQTLPNDFWGKLDAKIPLDWENETIPATAELQLGKMFTPSFGTYIDGLIGIGTDRPYDWGVGLGLRFNY